ncbi:MAG: DPP IV N-terminal domain-containing protein [Bacteroidales bacterium]|jgi:dipeptidyl-peptidase 4|nr:DPP IV N-terminal domain-containing protein [Bacteroidales bacterium]
MKKLILSTCFLFVFSLLFGQINPINLEGVFQGKYRKDNLFSLSWRPQTNQYAYIDRADNTERIILVNSKNGKKETLLTLSELKKQLTSLGEDAQSFSYFKWIDQNCLFFPANNIFYYLDAKKWQRGYDVPDNMETIDGTTDGSLFIVRKNENPNAVYVLSLNKEPEYSSFSAVLPEPYHEFLLCPDTGKNIVFGKAVHRNEWGIEEGQYFSANHNYIAFYRMDESMVEDYPLVNTTNPIATVEMMKYPMAGRTSHQVKVGIFDVKQSLSQNKPLFHYIQSDIADGEFLTNVTFSPDENFLYITHLNRGQNHAKLIKYDVKTGKKLAVLLEETDERFVEPDTRMIFLKNGNFIWQSDRDGWNHFYLYDFAGNLLKQITKGNWEVLESYGLDDKNENLFFLTNKDMPVDRYLYSVNLKTGKITNHTPKSGTHNPILSDDKTAFIDYFSDLHTPLHIYLSEINGKSNLLLESKNPYANHELGKDTIFSIENEHHDKLYCEMILPPQFDETQQYPCLIYVYGGPHSQLVTNTFMTAGVFLNYMAQKGYVIFVLDNRGTRNRGRDFEKCIHRNLGVYESEDQMTGVRYLKTLPFIDTTRLGLDGWSYGGFMTLTLITEHPEVFKAASCGGPVVNWEWYEVMYGERYMDTPQENPEGYNRANILHKIEKLKCPLLVMHGAQDHTVVWQHSLELLREAVDSDVQIDYFTFPTHDHNVMGINRVNMWKKIEQFHELHLKY